MSIQVKTQDEDLFLGMFSNGLGEDIRAEVSLYRPKDLAEIKDVALLAKEKLGAVEMNGDGWQSKPPATSRGYGGFKGWHSEGQNKPYVEGESPQALDHSAVKR